MSLRWVQEEPHIFKTECGKFGAIADYDGRNWRLYRMLASGKPLQLGVFDSQSNFKVAAHNHLFGTYQITHQRVVSEDGYYLVEMRHEGKKFFFELWPDKVVCHMYNISSKKPVRTIEKESFRGHLFELADQVLKEHYAR